LVKHSYLGETWQNLAKLAKHGYLNEIWLDLTKLGKIWLLQLNMVPFGKT
jgi:hypothetical protein